jgi:hypothetical protein
VHFSLPPNHQDKDSTAWQRQVTCSSKSANLSNETTGDFGQHFCPTAKHKAPHTTQTMTKQQVKFGIANSSIPSAISDTGATSTAGTLHDPFCTTNEPSNKVFLLPMGGTAQATHLSQLLLDVHAPANQVNIVPNLTHTHSSVVANLLMRGTQQSTTRMK